MMKENEGDEGLVIKWRTENSENSENNNNDNNKM